MKRVPWFPLAAAAFLALLPSAARSETLATPLNGTNSNDGIFFDIRVGKDIVFTGLQVRFADAAPSSDFFVYIRPGTHVGFEGLAAGWTLVATVNITSPGDAMTSSVGTFATPFSLAADSTYGVYVLRIGVGGVMYGNGDGTGTLEAFNDDLAVLEGTGSSGLFGGTASNRIPNVILHYEIADSVSPTLRILGQRRMVTNERRVRIYGILSDNVGPQSVAASYKQRTGSGKTKSVKKTLPAGGNGLFSLNVKTFPGSNPIKFTGRDKRGNLSPTAKVVVVGQ